MRMLLAALFGLFLLIDAPQPAQALSGSCAKRCFPAQQACIARYPDKAGYCNRRHRDCAYRCMGLR